MYIKIYSRLFGLFDLVSTDIKYSEITS